MRDSNVTALPVTRLPVIPRLALSRQWLVAALLVLGCGLFSENFAWSQQRVGGGKKKEDSKNTGSKTVTPKVEVDSEALPPGFIPPAEKDPIMEIDQPIALPEEITKLSKDVGKYQTALRKADTSEPGKTLIRNGIRYRLALMCQKEHRTTLSAKKAELLREVHSSGVAAALKPDQLRQFRTFVMQELVTQATPLLKNNYYVRLQIVLLLGELDLVEADAAKSIKAEVFTPAHIPLRDILTAPAVDDPAHPEIISQPEAIKVPAVNGLTRILRFGTPDVTARTKIAEAIISQLNDKKAHSWYQWRLVGALAFMDVALDQARNPFVVNALKAVVNDKQRKFFVRAEAAKSLGRVPLPPVVDQQNVVLAVAQLALELAQAAQAAPSDQQWKNVFWKLYLAFKPIDAADMNADKKTPAGLLNSARGAATPAYTVIVPIVSSVLKNLRLTAAQVAALQAWITSVAPANQQNPVPMVNQAAPNPQNAGGP